jgi:PAS domain S-box-containing protein
MNLINQNQEGSLDSLTFLSGTAIKFASSGISDSIFQFIGESLRELNPNAIIIVNSLDPEMETSTTEAFLSPPNLLESIISTLGFKPVGKVYKIDSSLLELNSGYIRKFEQGIHELSFKSIPKVVSKSLERLVNIGSIYGIAFMVDNKMYANAALILRKGDTLALRETIETFVRQASVTLKRIEAERSEEKYRSLFEHMTQGAYNMRSDGKITDVNRVALELLGLDKVDFLSKTNSREDWDLIDENHKSIPAKEFPASVALIKGEPVNEKIIGVFNPVKKDYVWLLINAIPQFKAGNKAPTSVFVTFQDITTLKRSIHRVMDSEANARAIMESTDDVIILLDPNGVIIDCNEAHAKRLNIERENLIGKNVFDLLPQDVGRTRKEAIKEVIQTGKPVCGEDFRAGLWNEYTIHPIVSHRGKVESVAIFSKDITDRKKAEEKLVESEREKASLIDNLPGFVYKCALDHEWTMYYISEECYKITGYHPEDFIFNKKISYNDIVHTNFRESLWDKWQVVISSRTSFRDEYQIVTADNQIRWVWEQGRGVYSKDGNLTHLEGFITDITERKEMEEALKESEARLVELNATKDKFFSIIAHDLKSPFNSIIGIGELLIEQIKKKEFEDIEEYASIMRDSSHKAMNLLTNLLEWSRSQTGRMDFNPEFLRLSQLADEVVDLLHYNANQKSISIKSQIPNSAVCYADKAMISSVLRNLVSNAIKFTGKGGEIVVSAKMTEDKYIVTVSDNGTGMSKNELDILFRIDKFYSTKGTENEGGTGLGLILCKEFVTRHGCEIWADSRKGEGSHFSFSLPRDSR